MNQDSSTREEKAPEENDAKEQERPSKRQRQQLTYSSPEPSLPSSSPTTKGNLKTHLGVVCDGLLMNSVRRKYAGDILTTAATTTTRPAATNILSNNNESELEMQELVALDEAWRAMMQERLHAKVTEINHDRTNQSMLLSLTMELLEHVASFWNEHDLKTLEETSPLVPRVALDKQWDYLDRQRILQSKVPFCTTRQRGHDFARLSEFARTMEQSAKLHYSNNTQTSDYEWPETLYSCSEFHQEFRGLEEISSDYYMPPSREFFIRISCAARQNEDDNAKTTAKKADFVWEGFQHDFVQGWQRNKQHFAQFCLHNEQESFLTFEFVGLWQQILGSTTEALTLQNAESLLNKLSITVVACDTTRHCANYNKPSPQLLVSTSGYFLARRRREVTFGFFQPQSPIAKERTAELKNCINIALLVRERDLDSFAILVEWGDFDHV